jgi:hypothetical protein
MQLFTGTVLHHDLRSIEICINVVPTVKVCPWNTVVLSRTFLASSHVLLFLLEYGQMRKTTVTWPVVIRSPMGPIRQSSFCNELSLVTVTSLAY